MYADVRHSDGASHPLGLLSADTFHHHGGDHNQACKAAGAQDSICQFLNAIVHVNLACTCRNMRPPLLSHPPSLCPPPFRNARTIHACFFTCGREGNVDMCTPLRRVYSLLLSFFFLGGGAGFCRDIYTASPMLPETLGRDGSCTVLTWHTCPSWVACFSLSRTHLAPFLPCKPLPAYAPWAACFAPTCTPSYHLSVQPLTA